MENQDYLLDNDPSKMPRQQFPYGSFGDRFIAALIDGFIVGIPMVGFNFFVMGVTPMDQSPNFLASGFNIVVAWLYDAFQVSSWRQATIGKRAMNLIVTDLGGNQLSFGQATIRHFAKILSGCTLFIGYLMAAFTDRKQALHDLVANTLVYKGQMYR